MRIEQRKRLSPVCGITVQGVRGHRERDTGPGLLRDRTRRIVQMQLTGRVNRRTDLMPHTLGLNHHRGGNA